MSSDHAADFEPADLDTWAASAEKELRGKPLDDLTRTTPEGIEVKPIYTEADLDGLSHLGGLPGQAPYVRGPARQAADTYFGGLGLELRRHDTLWGGAIQFVDAASKAA